MDFGSSGLFERFERHFGKKVTMCLEALIAVTITSVCVGAIWQFLAPIAIWLAGAFAGWQRIAVQIPDVASFATIFVALGGAFFSALWLIIDRAKAEQELTLQRRLLETLRRRIYLLERKAAQRDNGAEGSDEQTED